MDVPWGFVELRKVRSGELHSVSGSDQIWYHNAQSGLALTAGAAVRAPVAVWLS